MPQSDLPDFTFRVNGAEAPFGARSDVRSVTVQEDLEALSMFSLVLYNWDDDRLRVSWSDSKLFAIGNEVELSLGYVDDLARVMLGEITSIEPAFTSDEPPTVTVRGYDYRHRLGRGRKTRTFARMKDSAIASQVAREAGLRAQAHDTRVMLPHVMQSNQTDWQFLRQRAHLIGYEVYVRDKVLYFQPPEGDAEPAMRLSLGQDIAEFTARLSSLAQIDQVTVRGWDVSKKDVIVGSAGVGQEPRMGGRASGPRTAQRAFGKAGVSSVDLPVHSKAEADQIARGRFTAAAMTYVQGDVIATGHPRLRAGTVVEILGAGENFSGPYYVTSVTHEMTPEQGYRTSFTVRRTAT
jgi:phage protein D